MTLSFGATAESKRGWKAGTLLLTVEPVSLGQPVITAATSTVSALTVGCTTFPSNADFVKLRYKLTADSGYTDGPTGLVAANFPYELEVGTTPTGASWDVIAIAYNEYTESAASEIETASTVTPVVAPTAPTISNATAFSATRIDIAISGGSGADSWQAQYRTPSGSGSYTAHGAVTVGTTSYSFTGLTASTQYDLRVVATNTADSANSNVLTQSTPASGATLITFEQFNSPPLPVAGWDIDINPGSGGGVSLSTDTGANYGGSAGSLRGTFPNTQRSSVYAVYDLSSLNTSHVYLRFRAKLPGNKQGCKFVKIFSGNTGGNPNNYSNATFGQVYSSGNLKEVSFGDGSGAGNDTGNVHRWDGTFPSFVGRSFGTAVLSTPQNRNWTSSDWGTGWHLFEFYWKFNSGTSAATEVADGEYLARIDGLVFGQATGLFNRHWSNAPIDRVEFFGYGGNTQTWELWYDNIEITQNAFGTSSV